MEYGSGARYSENRCVGKPLRGVSCDLNGSGNVWPNGQRDTRTRSNGNRRADGTAGLRLGEQTQLPATHQAIALERQRVEAAQREAVAHVEFRRSVIAARIVGVLQYQAFPGRQGVVIQRL